MSDLSYDDRVKASRSSYFADLGAALDAPAEKIGADTRVWRAAGILYVEYTPTKQMTLGPVEDLPTREALLMVKWIPDTLHFGLRTDTLEPGDADDQTGLLPLKPSVVAGIITQWVRPHLHSPQ